MTETQVQFHLNKTKIRAYVDRLFHLIRVNCLNDVKEHLRIFPPDQCNMILCSSIGGCTPLFMAASLGKLKIVSYLLGLSLRQGRREMCDSWKKHRHPLTGAMVNGHLCVVELLLRNMSNINEPFHGPFTPLIFAIFLNNIYCVQLLVLLGANTDIPSFNGCTPLTISHINEDICQILIASNANVNHQDVYGLTALHAAVSLNSVKCAKVLVKAGANVQVRSHQGMTPLMWAAVNRKSKTLDYMCQNAFYSELEKIEALEVFSAYYICTEPPNIQYCVDTLVQRGDRFPKKTVFPLQEILDFSKEFTTKKELENLKDDPLHLAFQGILIVERVLGRNNGLYLRLLLETALIANRKNHMNKVWQLIDYIQKYYEPGLDFVSICLWSLVTLFKELTKDGSEDLFTNGAFELFKIIALATVKLWLFHKKRLAKSPRIENRQYTKVVDTFLCMTSQIKRMNPPEQHMGKFYKVVVSVVKADPRIVANYSLLHRAIKLSNTLKTDSVELIRILLECGSNIDVKDHYRRTPLLYAIKHATDKTLPDIVAPLLEYNCHLDCRSDEGFTALEFLRLTKLKIIPKIPLTLQCQAAVIILENKIPYEDVLNKFLSDFISLHK